MDRSTPFLFILTLVFFMKALLPYGYMPAFSSEGKVEIVICTLDGQKKVLVDEADALGSSSDHGKNYSSVCPYSILNISAYLASVPYLERDAAYQEIAFISLGDEEFFSTHESFYHSRGPPISIF